VTIFLLTVEPFGLDRFLLGLGAATHSGQEKQTGGSGRNVR